MSDDTALREKPLCTLVHITLKPRYNTDVKGEQKMRYSIPCELKGGRRWLHR